MTSWVSSEGVRPARRAGTRVKGHGATGRRHWGPTPQRRRRDPEGEVGTPRRGEGSGALQKRRSKVRAWKGPGGAVAGGPVAASGGPGGGRSSGRAPPQREGGWGNTVPGCPVGETEARCRSPGFPAACSLARLSPQAAAVLRAPEGPRPQPSSPSPSAPPATSSSPSSYPSSTPPSVRPFLSRIPRRSPPA